MKYGKTGIAVLLLSYLLSGCAPVQEAPLSTYRETEMSDPNQAETNGSSEEDPVKETEVMPETVPTVALSQPLTRLRPEWASCFGELNGAAVIFDPDENTFQIYNEDLADVRRSPCSTFKIISSLAGLEKGFLHPENSTRPWSGEIFWNDDWNRDIDFPSAFRTSCVWYFRQLIDDMGPDVMQEILEELSYGNCDISDWEGHLNHNNRNPALTGFWIESSLKISPREQTQVLERIFGRSSRYSPTLQETLEEVMFLSEASEENCSIYGKTGMGKAGGVVVDAWYAGFADVGHRVYFCVYLGETANQEVSSGAAREIAVSLIKENFPIS